MEALRTGGVWLRDISILKLICWRIFCKRKSGRDGRPYCNENGDEEDAEGSEDDLEYEGDEESNFYEEAEQRECDDHNTGEIASTGEDT